MLKKIIWNNDYCIGIPEIDSQHCKIIDQINYLIDNLNSEDKAYLNGKLLMNLDKYSKEHFFTEEEFLRKINYPNLEDHLKLHKTFKMNTVKSAISVLKGNEHVPEETIKFLKKWWSNHILKADMEFKNFIPKS
jgi:hemerythrin-like metal-binding protein